MPSCLYVQVTPRLPSLMCYYRARHLSPARLTSAWWPCRQTAICCRYSQDTFSPVHSYTSGVEFYLKRLRLTQERSVTLQLWDVGGTSLTGGMLDKYLYGAHVSPGQAALKGILPRERRVLRYPSRPDSYRRVPELPLFCPLFYPLFCPHLIKYGFSEILVRQIIEVDEIRHHKSVKFNPKCALHVPEMRSSQLVAESVHPTVTFPYTTCQQNLFSVDLTC